MYQSGTFFALYSRFSALRRRLQGVLPGSFGGRPAGLNATSGRATGAAGGSKRHGARLCANGTGPAPFPTEAGSAVACSALIALKGRFPVTPPVRHVT
jgi:hypothetical protein